MQLKNNNNSSSTPTHTYFPPSSPSSPQATEGRKRLKARSFFVLRYKKKLLFQPFYFGFRLFFEDKNTTQINEEKIKTIVIGMDGMLWENGIQKHGILVLRNVI